MSPGSSKRSTEGAASTTAKYNVGDVVLAKIRGFPAWPGIIMDDENVPRNVLKEKPIAKHRDVYTIRFFPAADYHWAGSRDLSLLTSRQIEAFLQNPHKKSGELKQAYKIAQDPKEWNDEQNRIVQNYEKSLLAAAEEEEENEDQLQEEDQDDEEYGDSKKRKRDGASSAKVRESASEKQRKKQKVTEAKGKVNSSDAKVPSSGRKTANGDGEAEEEAVDTETKKVKEWRHKLQRAFIGAKEGVGALVAKDMPTHDATFKVVESYDNMTIDQLRISKIGKVMKRIVQLSDIPRNDEFNFRERAQKLVDRWNTIVSGVPGQDAPVPEDGKSVSDEQAEVSAPTQVDADEAAATTDEIKDEAKPSNDA